MVRRASAWVAIAFALLACSASDGAEDEPGAGDEASDDAAAETGGEGLLGDDCETTELLASSSRSFALNLRQAAADPRGIASSCGLTGPELFVRVRVDTRADLRLRARGREFTPQLAVLPPGCIAGELDEERPLACANDGLPITLSDLRAGTELLVVVGVRADDAALASDLSEDGLVDALDVELEIEQRAVLAEGERCEPLSPTRCETGTACIAEIEDEDSAVAIARCRRLAADSCAAPGELELSLTETTELVIASDELHSDAHSHACAGWRRPERVEQLRLPAELPETATLQVRVDDARVGLALRRSDCEPSTALACAPPSEDAAELSFGGDGSLAALAQAGADPLLFIELPRERDADIAVELELKLD